MNEWYLLKVSTNEVFGPLPIEQLRFWASEAKISPMDRLSNDERVSWRRAPMIAELQMDWLIEMPDNYLYGPTSVGTLQEFLATGEIDEHIMVINTAKGSKSRIKDLDFFKASPQRMRGAQEISDTDISDAGGAANTLLKQRINWLEEQVMELQRDVDLWQQQSSSIRQQFIEATGRDPF